MTDEYVLITGANGEIGQSLIEYLCSQNKKKVIALDLAEPCQELLKYCQHYIQGNILDQNLLQDLFDQYQFSVVYHLASILSSRAEKTPSLAQQVNVQGTFNLLELSVQQFDRTNQPVLFFYPSSIAVYGLPHKTNDTDTEKVTENQYLNPITLYGTNKLACEQLGIYFSNYYRLLDDNFTSGKIDFRCLRFPGLISAKTVPTGGTTDYGPEMLHHAAQHLPYACFVRPDTRLPFMAMHDAVKSIIMLTESPQGTLTQQIYNVTSFNPSAIELLAITHKAYPNAEISWMLNPARQKIVDSWPADIDDSKARQDWGWQPDYDMQTAFSEYLLPSIQKRYQ
jgi:nucleoside-diphosphate-sugar epimerase